MRRLLATVCLALDCGSSAPTPGASTDAEAVEPDAALPKEAARPAYARLAPDAASDPDASPAEDLAAPDAGNTGWPAVADYGARGPYAVARDRDTGPGAAYDVFRPAPLDPRRKHPIISWANGTLFGLTDYQKLLEHWA